MSQLQTTLPTLLPDPDDELRTAVSASYHLSRQQGLAQYDAWLAGRKIALQIRPELDDGEIGHRVMRIIAWTLMEHDAQSRPKGSECLQ